MYWYNWLSWWWALGCSKHVEKWNKHIKKYVKMVINTEKNLCWSVRAVEEEKYPIVLTVIWTPAFNTDRIQTTRSVWRHPLNYRLLAASRSVVDAFKRSARGVIFKLIWNTAASQAGAKRWGDLLLIKTKYKRKTYRQPSFLMTGCWLHLKSYMRL